MELGIDCGGSKTKAVVVSKDEVIDHVIVKKTSTKEVLFSVIDDLVKKHKKIDFIGIGFPAAVKNGKVDVVNNIPSWNKTDIEKKVKNKFGIKCKVENDANCFTLNEALLEENKKYNIVFGITLGTGLGGGIIINHKIVSGTIGAAGEINKIPYKGKTLEDYTSRKFFMRNYKKEPLHIFRKAELGDKHEKKIIASYAKHLGVMLSIVVNTVDPDCIVFGGNISKSFTHFEKEMKKELKKHVYPKAFENVIIKASKAEHGPSLGAARLKSL